tara:strand:- start:24994 stop:26754 length:1761 start_codon:yes stop_codon:yes gene_type:complete
MINQLKKLWFLIDRKQKKALGVLLFLLSIGMLLEIIGLGIIIPVFSIILNPEDFESFEILNFRVGRFFTNVNHSDLVLYLLGILVLIYTVKSFFLSYITHKQNQILERLHAKLSSDLFANYINQSYLFHINRDFAEILKNLNSEIRFFSNYFKFILSISVELLLSISVLLTILIIEPVGAISVGFFFIFVSLIFYLSIKKRLTSWGIEREKYDNISSKIRVESFSVIKDVILYDKHKYFTDYYKSSQNNLINIIASHQTLSQVSRFFLELISVIGVVFFIIIMQIKGESIFSLISSLGVIVAASFRIIPSINRILGGIQNLKYYSPSVSIIYNELKLKSEKLIKDYDSKLTFLNSINFDNISFRYSKKSKWILKNISFKICRGETVGIIGESGSGKSTFVDILNGLLTPLSGRIEVDKVDISSNLIQWHKNIGYVGQEIFLLDDSIKKNIAFGIDEAEISEKKIIELIKTVELSDFVKDLDRGVDSNVGERGVKLSGGQRQRIGIARALYNDPEILIFDEATASLDTPTEKKIMKSIYKLKKSKTIIIVAHRLSTLYKCDKIYEINNKIILQKDKLWKKNPLQSSA